MSFNLHPFAGGSYAMSSVVDKHRGIILTNRHVVKPGKLSCFFSSPHFKFREDVNDIHDLILRNLRTSY